MTDYRYMLVVPSLPAIIDGTDPVAVNAWMERIFEHGDNGPAIVKLPADAYHVSAICPAFADKMAFRFDLKDNR